MRAVLIGVLALATLIAATLLVGAARWRAATAGFAARLDARRATETVSLDQVDSLPHPVARYFRAALRDGQPRFRFAELRQEGTFLVKPPDGWKPFHATHRLATDPPAFLWDAGIALAPGLPMRVRDRFLDGAGSMHGALLGLVTVVRVEGTQDIAAGALHRWLAEGPWCPTVLLPSPWLRWTALDDSSARATLTVDAIAVAADFHFGPDGLVDRVFVPERMRDVNGRGVPTPWEGRFRDYAEWGGMRIPTGGDVGWVLEGAWRPYFRGRITDAAYR